MDSEELHCGKGALTDAFGWSIQALLAALAFLCLVLKRFCEPSGERRSWLIWFYDTSKQGLGSMVIHMINVLLATLFQGDPCTWYLISFLLDSSVGILMLWVGIRTCQWLAHFRGCKYINFGEYGSPPSALAWAIQCGLYIGLLMIVKVAITLIMQLNFWDDVRRFILAPVTNPKAELAIVMLIIPFFLNALMFWVLDNFLMLHHSRPSPTCLSTNHNKLHFQWRGEVKGGSESEEGLLSGDEELLNDVLVGGQGGAERRNNAIQNC